MWPRCQLALFLLKERILHLVIRFLARLAIKWLTPSIFQGDFSYPAAIFFTLVNGAFAMSSLCHKKSFLGTHMPVAAMGGKKGCPQAVLPLYPYCVRIVH